MPSETLLCIHSLVTRYVDAPFNVYKHSFRQQQEQERMDQFHALIYKIALEERLYTRDVVIPHRQTRALDVGYGTGTSPYYITQNAAEPYFSKQEYGFNKWPKSTPRCRSMA